MGNPNKRKKLRKLEALKLQKDINVKIVEEVKPKLPNALVELEVKEDVVEEQEVLQEEVKEEVEEKNEKVEEQKNSKKKKYLQEN